MEDVWDGSLGFLGSSTLLPKLQHGEEVLRSTSNKPLIRIGPFGMHSTTLIATIVSEASSPSVWVAQSHRSALRQSDCETVKE